uniref:Enoyl reductase (ER) domain-containing protein n=1 Tax=Lotharella globosa TaxID=91324 RepID=A0A7S4DZS6_9EUKA
MGTKKESMKALVLKEYKAWEEQDMTPSVVEIPKPKAGEVLIQAKAASINPVDYIVISGVVDAWAKPSPLTPGYDVSGVVVDVGSDVTDFKVGDEVFAVNWALDEGQQSGQHDDNAKDTKTKGPVAGTFAEYCVIPAKKVSKKNPAVSFEEAAAIALVGTTALQSLKHLDLGKGKTVLVLGGSGSVGNIAVQLAKVMGAEVITTASSRTEAYVKAAGADKIINYRKEKWEEVLKDVDAVMDAIGEEKAFERSKKIVKEGGSYLSIKTFDTGLDPTAHAPQFKYACWYCLKNNVKDQDYLMELLATKKLKVNVEKKVPFTKEGLTELFKVQSAGKSMGKNVIVF